MALRDFFSRRNLFIAGFIAIVLLLGFLLYLLFFSGTTAPITPGTTPTTTPDGQGGLPDTGDIGDRPVIEDLEPGELPDAIARGGITQTERITNTSVSNVSLGSNNRISYYDQFTGQFYTVDNQGNIRTLSDTSFPEVDSVAWSGSGDKAIIEFPDGANIFYDFDTETQVTLPSHWTDFSYSPVDDEIIFKSIGLEPENNFLSIADEQGNGARIIQALGPEADRVQPLWSPTNQIVANYSESLDAGRSEVFLIGQNKENFRSLTVNGYNFEGKWNTNGTQLLYEVTSPTTGNNPSLWIVNAQATNIGSGRRPLNIQTTVDKCVFADARTVYCAVPQFLPEGTGLIESLGNDIPDDIYKIDTVTGTSGLLAQLDIPLPVESIVVSQDGRYLYFTDELTGALRKLQLR